MALPRCKRSLTPLHPEAVRLQNPYKLINTSTLPPLHQTFSADRSLAVTDLIQPPTMRPISSFSRLQCSYCRNDKILNSRAIRTNDLSAAKVIGLSILMRSAALAANTPWAGRRRCGEGSCPCRAPTGRLWRLRFRGWVDDQRPVGGGLHPYRLFEEPYTSCTRPLQTRR